MRFRRTVSLALAVVAIASGAASADNPKDSFTKAWVGRTVVVKQPLYTLSYDERGVMGKKNDKRDGLNVITPFKGTYFQFVGRQGKDTLINEDPQGLVADITLEYQADDLDFRNFQKIQPNLINRYDPGKALVVKAVRVERDFVRLVLLDTITDFGDEPATALTIQWPSAFSRSFSEREAVEGLILQFVELVR